MKGQGHVLLLYLLVNLYMSGAVREVNARGLWKGLELLSVNGGRFGINLLLLADDRALVADFLRWMSPTLQSAMESRQEARITQIEFIVAFDRANNH